MYKNIVLTVDPGHDAPRTRTSIGADVVVTASHAPDRACECLVGSRADRVMRRSPLSVLVLR